MRIKHLLLGAAASLLCASGAQAGTVTPNGWYVSLAAGANFIEDGRWDWGQYGVGITSAQTYTWDSGFAVLASVGYAFTDNWRVEFEVAYRDNQADAYSGGNTSAELWELSQMVNVLYDFSLGGPWTASVGAGIGGNLVDQSWPGDSSSDDYVLQGQLIAQLAYRLAERWQAYVDYRYVVMEDPTFDDPEDLTDYWEIEKTEHTVSFGIRFDLQRDGAAPTPPPPVPVAVPERPRQYIVFFGFNKSNLTSEGLRVVAEAAAAAKEFGSAQIIVVGHTDTVGGAGYNLKLSLKRAGAVKSALSAQGIEPGMITTSGRGESELLVDTGDGVKEPQNRRATIDLN